VNEFLTSWIDRVFSGFVVMTPLLFLLHLSWKSRRQLWHHLLLASNILLLIAATFETIILLIGLSQIFAVEDGSTYNFRSRITGPYWYCYWIMILGRTLLPQLLWVRKYRSSYRQLCC
jgi:hypothetical protein